MRRCDLLARRRMVDGSAHGPCVDEPAVNLSLDLHGRSRRRHEARVGHDERGRFWRTCDSVVFQSAQDDLAADRIDVFDRDDRVCFAAVLAASILRTSSWTDIALLV